MTEQDFHKELAGRDKIIDRLILTAIKNRMTDVDVFDLLGIQIASKSAYDPFAADYIADYKWTKEEHSLIENELYNEWMKQSKNKIRFRQLKAELTDLAKRIRIDLLKNERDKEYLSK